MLTSERITTIIGRTEDMKIAEIIGTGTTEEELLEAKRWLAGYQRTLSEADPVRPSVVMKVYEILRTDEPDFMED